MPAKAKQDTQGNAAASIRIGTSGWSYKEWERVFYPDSKTPKLSFYSSVFGTAEIDSTFYANPQKGLVFGWSRNTPAGFEFAVKLPKKITHEKKLDLSKGVEIDLVEFLDLMRPLHESKKLGPLLIQLPPSFGASKKRDLVRFFEVLPKECMFAVEFRNKTWLKEKNLHLLLSKYGVANTVVDEPLLPVDLTPTADFAFIRWHGRGEAPWYNYRYKKEEIEPWVDRVKTDLKGVKKIYAYFNNHFHGYAIENSLEFLEMLGLASKEQKELLSKVTARIEGKPEDSEQKTLGEY